MSSKPNQKVGSLDLVSFSDSTDVKRTFRHISSEKWDESSIPSAQYKNKDRVLKILERNKEARDKARKAEEEKAALEVKEAEKAPVEEEKKEEKFSGDVGSYVEGAEQDEHQVGYQECYQECYEEEEVPMSSSMEPDENGYVGGYQFGDDDEDQPMQTIEEEPRAPSPAPKKANALSETSVLTSYKGLQDRDSCDWSGRFTSLIEEIKNQRANTPFKRRIEVNEELMRLSSDFLLSAELYGKTIISEMFLPLNERTVKPVNAGGVAGGEKYIIRNILFKFALDCANLYHGDANSAKAAGHELKSVMSFHNCFIKNFHLPLMAIIDYRGFRLVAMSYLPIKNGRLIYGSEDLGNTCHNDNPDFSEKMRIAGQKLNLAGHTIDNKFIYAAFDVEGHEVDGRFYLLDLARTFPPEFPLRDVGETSKTWPPQAFLYRLLRPELVKKSPFPLCSDAGNKIIQQDPEWKTYNRNARAMKAQLINDIIPTFGVRLVPIVAKSYASYEKQYQSKILSPFMSKFGIRASGDLQKKTQKGNASLVFGESFPLKQYLHSEGINMRHMGYLMKSIREEVPDGTPGKEHTLALIFLEMAARTIRQDINAQYRFHMRLKKVPLEEPYRMLLVDNLNLVFGDSDKSSMYWNTLLKGKLLEKFGVLAFREEELSDRFDIRRMLSHKHPKGLESGKTLLFLRLKKLMGFLFDDITENTALTNAFFYQQPRPFDDIDLRAIGARVKHMAVVNHARGYIYKMRGSEIKVTQPEKASIMLRKALENFDEVLESDPTNFVTLRNCGQVMQIIETINSKLKDPNCIHLDLDLPAVFTAREFYMRAVDASPKDTHSLYQLAQFLVKCNEKKAAEEYFLRSLEADPKHIAALVDFGLLLRDLGHLFFAKLVFDCVNEEEMKNIFRIDW